MDVSNQMLEAVSHAKKQAKSAEQQFDFAADMVNIKSSSGIDLFGGRAVSQVADIASSVRKACDELYASYQSLVLMLDQQCRPLLSQNPSTRAVKEVMEMIKWLNKESEIGSNFSGSLNGSSLGDLVNVKYFASMECQMIQKHWENIYSTMPGTAEEDRAFDDRQMDEFIATRAAERQAKQKVMEWERQEREKELRERQERNAIHADATAATREDLKLAQDIMGTGMYVYAFVKADGTVDAFHYDGPFAGTPGDVSQFSNIKAVVCTNDIIVGLRNDGTCIATNSGLTVNQWSNIREVAAGPRHIVGLRNNGTCVSCFIHGGVGYGYDGQCDVDEWRDIAAVACGLDFTIGLKRNGTIVYTGDKAAREVENWENIALITVATGQRPAVVGVTKSGEVLSMGNVKIGAMKRAENIIQVCICGGLAYALESDGTIVGGKPDLIEPSKKMVVTENALAMSVGDGLLVLKKDGCVQRIGGSLAFTVALPSEYRLFKSYDGYIKERNVAEEECRRREQQKKAYRDAGVCQHCGGTFKKSLFGGCKCGRCGKKKDY